jgi:hypothetical protein
LSGEFFLATTQLFVGQMTDLACKTVPLKESVAIIAQSVTMLALGTSVYGGHSELEGQMTHI